MGLEPHPHPTAPHPCPQQLTTPLLLPFPKYTPPQNTSGGSLGQGRGKVRQLDQQGGQDCTNPSKGLNGSPCPEESYFHFQPLPQKSETLHYGKPNQCPVMVGHCCYWRLQCIPPDPAMHSVAQQQSQHLTLGTWVLVLITLSHTTEIGRAHV